MNNSTSSTLQINSNDIEQSLFTIAINTLNKDFKPQVLKVVIFYISKIFILLFKKMKDIDNYFSMAKYITKIQNVTDDKDALSPDENFPFLKENLICIGDSFSKSKAHSNRIIQSKEMHKLLISYYISVYKSIDTFLLSNYTLIKKMLFEDESNSKREAFPMSLKVDSNENNDLTKEPNYISFNSINQSLFSFLSLIIKDVVVGKNILNIIDKEIKEKFTNDANKLNEILLLALLYKCKGNLNMNKTFITAIFEFISSQILENINTIYYYDILLDYCQLIIKDEILSERCMRLFAQIFIQEISSKSQNGFMFIDKINDLLAQNKEISHKLVMKLVLCVSGVMGQVEDTKNKSKVAEQLGVILEKYSNLDLLSRKVEEDGKKKEIIDKEDFLDVMKNTTIGMGGANGTRGMEDEMKIEYVDFFIKFFSFVESNYTLDVNNDFQMRKNIYVIIINYIYELDLLLSKINYRNQCVNQILLLIQILNYFNSENGKLHFEDAYVIYKLLACIYKKITKEQKFPKEQTSIFYLYTVIISILIIIKVSYKLQISIEKIHSDIQNSLSTLSQGGGQFLAMIDIVSILNTYSSSSPSFLSDFFNQILALLTSRQRVVPYSPEKFNQVIDLIYSKVFGHVSSLNSFFESQMKSPNLGKILAEVDSIWDTIGKKDTDIITEGNITTYGDILKDDLNDISIHFTDDIKKLSSRRRISKFSEENNTNDIEINTNIKKVPKFELGNTIDDVFRDNDEYINVKI